MYIGMPRRPSKPGSAKTAASYCSANRRKNVHGVGWADEQSKWHRHTHRPAVRALTRLAGWQSCTIVRSASRSSFFALSPFMSTQRASPSSLSTRSAPSSAACKVRAVA